MTTRRRNLVIGGAFAALAVAALGYWLMGPSVPTDCDKAGRPPRISPDYAGITIPPNIAPMNFLIDEPGGKYFVRIAGASGRAIDISQSAHDIDIPAGPWKKLLAANRGGRITIDVYVRKDDGRWTQFDTITNAVAAEAIDNHLVYRLVYPGAHNWANLGLYQRDLEGFEESKILHSFSIKSSCCNCHTFHNNDPDTLLFHVRSGPTFPGAGMIMWRDGKAVNIDTRTSVNPAPVGYASWHPGGRLIAFSVNKIKLFSHSASPDLRDQIDYDSDLCIYDIDEGKLVFPPKIAVPDQLETFPCWSPDGNYLYFCRAPMLWDPMTTMVPQDTYKSVLYSLMRIRYNAQDKTWGEVETVLPAEDVEKRGAAADLPRDKRYGRSILEPRISPDGRFILLAVVDYGNVPIFQNNSDLYIYDTATGRHRYIDHNSDDCDSWHCWSSNGRWVVFSSRRKNGQFAHPYFTYIDVEGKDSKPFVLPQKDPAFYETFLKAYNIPELVTGPVHLNEEQIVNALMASQDPSRKAIPITGATPTATTTGPAAP